MPNQRSKDQKLIAVPLHKDLLAKVDEARAATSRSAWVRNAIADLLRKLNYDVPSSLTDAPDRAGKGGAKKKAKPRLSVEPAEGKSSKAPGLKVADNEMAYDSVKKIT